MTVRFFVAAIAACLPTLNLFAHDGSHSGMADLAIAVHHFAVPFIIVTFLLAGFVVIRLRKRTSLQKNLSGSSRS